MALAQGLNPKAQQAGRLYASELIAMAIERAMKDFPGDHAAQFAFLATMFAELRRVATQGQNKGFRI